MNIKKLWNKDAPIRDVKAVHFTLLSPREIRDMSVIPGGINNEELGNPGNPAMNGLMDPRLGVAVKYTLCMTCGGDLVSCPGHFGHIELAAPAFHYGLLPKVIKILKCICVFCSKLLVDTETPKVQAIIASTKHNPRLRLYLMYNLSKSEKICKHDQHEQPNIYLCKTELKARFKDQPIDNKSHVDLSAAGVMEILERITDENCVYLGFDAKLARPEWLIFSVLPVAPICVRPPVVANGLLQAHDDMTYKLSDILRANHDLQKHLSNGNRVSIQNALKFLQFHVTTLIDNEISMLPRALHTTGRPLKCIKSRLRGKTGRLRANLMGKRVDFSARTVIVPDPNLYLDEIGIPLSMAQTLTYPEHVNKHSIKHLSTLVQNGPKGYPGANFVIRKNGDRFDLRFSKERDSIVLELGDIVERHLKNGDFVVVNRQPSLHKMSMMGHRVRIFPHSAFRLNLSCTTPYNADFDGDEMNLHVPQNFAAISEVQSIHLATRQIINPQSSAPIIGIVQDSLTGAFLMTHKKIFIERNGSMNLVFQSLNWNGKMPKAAILKPRMLWTGKQIFSTTVPKNCNYRQKNNNETPFDWCLRKDSQVIIVSGYMITGILSKETLGCVQNSIVQTIHMELSFKAVGDFVASVQNVVNAWLLIHGCSIGISDLINNSKNKLDTVLKDVELNKRNNCNKAHLRQLRLDEGETIRSTFESNLYRILKECQQQGTEVFKNSIPDDNTLKNIVSAGAKGTFLNLLQIFGWVGQQTFPIDPIDRSRNLPHFTHYDFSAKANGFIENSYINGLHPAEFYFDAIAGRGGLIDIEVRTAETGYAQRRLIKSMESLMVHYDGTVRNSNKSVIQFCYGEDGMMCEALEFQNLNTLKLSNSAFEQKYKNNNTEYKCILQDEYEQLKSEREKLNKIFNGKYEGFFMPCNFDRIIWNMSGLCKKEYRLTAEELNEGVKFIERNCVIFPGEGRTSKESNDAATFLFRCVLHAKLSSTSLINDLHLTSQEFHNIKNKIVECFNKAKVHPGEMVGTIAAQSIIEPATQMTLNTFHYSGLSSKNIILGLPRLNEILNVTKNIKSPTMIIYIEPKLCEDITVAETVTHNIKRLKLSDALLKRIIYRQRKPSKLIISENQTLINSNEAEISQWICKFVLNKEILSANQISTKQLTRIIEAHNFSNMLFDFNDYKAEVVVEMRFNQTQSTPQKKEKEFSADDEYNWLLRISREVIGNLYIKGIQEVTKACIRKPLSNDYPTIFKSKNKNEWIIETDGSALSAIMAYKFVDRRRTISNSVSEIYNILGIEAARKLIEHELNVVLKCYGSLVNIRHIDLLCEIMTNSGTLTPITRHGRNLSQASALMRSTFEESTKVLLNAAVHGEMNPIRGVSEKLILGALPDLGTGCMELKLMGGNCLKYDIHDENLNLLDKENETYQDFND